MMKYGGLSAQPYFRIQLACLAPQLELEDVFGTNGSNSLTGTYLLTSAHMYGTKVTVDGYVASMTYHDSGSTAKTEHGTDLSVENAAY